MLHHTPLVEIQTKIGAATDAMLSTTAEISAMLKGNAIGNMFILPTQHITDIYTDLNSKPNK